MANIFNLMGGGNSIPQMGSATATKDLLGFMKNPQVVGSIKNMASQLQSMQGLQGGMGNMMQMMAQNNPQIKMIMDMMNNGGGNPEQIVTQKLQEMGIDKNEFMQELQSMM